MIKPPKGSLLKADILPEMGIVKLRPGIEHSLHAVIAKAVHRVDNLLEKIGVVDREIAHLLHAEQIAYTSHERAAVQADRNLPVGIVTQRRQDLCGNSLHREAQAGQVFVLPDVAIGKRGTDLRRNGNNAGLDENNQTVAVTDYAASVRALLKRLLLEGRKKIARRGDARIPVKIKAELFHDGAIAPSVIAVTAVVVRLLPRNMAFIRPLLHRFSPIAKRNHGKLVVFLIAQHRHRVVPKRHVWSPPFSCSVFSVFPVFSDAPRKKRAFPDCSFLLSMLVS